MKDTFESNRLIAEFMGAKFKEVKEQCSVRGDDWVNEFIEVRGIKTPNFFGVPQIGNLRYDESWDWLLPVVEKIEKMDYGFKMCRKVVEVYIDSTKETIIRRKESCRLDSLYVAVVDFIEFHNKHLK